MSKLELKAAHKPVQDYYAALRQRPLRVDGALRSFSASIPLAHRMGEGSRVRERERAGVRCRSDSSDFSPKQQFLNAFFEKLFQGLCVKVADTHGIVYTPHSIVRLMAKSVADLRLRLWIQPLNGFAVGQPPADIQR